MAFQNGSEPLDTLLSVIYDPRIAHSLADRIQQLLSKYRPLLPSIIDTHLQGRLSERDAVLITYGDQVRTDEAAPLQSLASFCAQRLDGVVSSIHILPFFPYSSDDGFAVIDYRRIDPALGDWAALDDLRRGFALMFDMVINHVSSRSEWFQGFLRDDPLWRDFFITVEGAPDLSRVVRPRTLPLLTRYETAAGPKAVWTTFSADQVDLNYANPDVLLEMIDLLLFYVTKGAELIRLDAIAYLWKEIGTSCIHLPQTHAIIRLFRAVLDRAAAYVFLITETNVPHRENLTYFGDGKNEAQLVYNFALPPLMLHTFHSASARALSEWAAGLETPSEQTAFFNFLASHDGIGINPVRGILSGAEIDRLIAAAQKHGGLVSYKQDADGSQSAYELNIGYFDALSDPNSDESPEIQVRRFLAAHAILCALPGVPGIYFHSLFGSRSWAEGVRQTGRNRTINRQKLDYSELEGELADPASLRSRVFAGFKAILQARRSCRAFHPNGAHRVADAGEGVFAVWRFAPGEAKRVLCLHNVTGAEQNVRLPGFDCPLKDLMSGEIIEWSAGKMLALKPYQSAWLSDESA